MEWLYSGYETTCLNEPIYDSRKLYNFPYKLYDLTTDLYGKKILKNDYCMLLEKVV